MSTPSLFLRQPTYHFSSVHSFESGNNNSSRTLKVSFRLRSSRLILHREFLQRRKIGAVSSDKTMNELAKTSAFRGDGGNGGEERLQAFEQEAFIDGSSELRSELVFGSGIEAGLNRLSKWVVAALFGSIILLRHDAAALWAAIGSISNSVLSVVLKKILNQERPVANLRSDPGMPSSHAQSISYISVFAILSIMEWLGISEVSLFLSGLVLALCSYFTWLRVSQKLHTVSQIVVGAILGSVFSILWYLTWNLVVFEAFVSSFFVRVVVFLVAAAFGLGFAVYVVLNWFRDDR